MRGKRISKELKQKALELFQQGFSYTATSSRLGLRLSTVKNWYLFFRSGDTSWVESNYRKINISTLQRAVDEYLNTDQGYGVLSVKYGISRTSLLAAKRNFVNFGVVQLPQGRNSMQRLQEQKQKIKEELQSIEEHKEPLLDKKGLQEMRELLVVNLALLEVLEQSHPDELKKKEFRQQRKRLEGKLACVERALFCM